MRESGEEIGELHGRKRGMNPNHKMFVIWDLISKTKKIIYPDFLLFPKYVKL